ncbi:MAG TPA: hypothetical protein DHV02_00625 [Neisseriales bacterium]|nr:hypothetical protein [Neisseriales bacterium]
MSSIIPTFNLNLSRRSIQCLAQLRIKLVKI